jgi:hypothetical protein
MGDMRGGMLEVDPSMIDLQAEVARHQEMIQMLSNISKEEHDRAMTAVNNAKA